MRQIQSLVARTTLSILILGLLCSGRRSIAGDRASAEASPADISIARQRIDKAIERDGIESPGKVVVVYFTPRNRKPALNHVDRIRRVMAEAARFFNDELRRQGFSGRSMRIRDNADDQIDVIDLVGSETRYGREDGPRIRQEIEPLLRERGIDPRGCVVITFCNLSDYDPGRSTISHRSPFYGGGHHLTGNAWVCDSELLDSEKLLDTTFLFDYENGPITIGKYNSIFIGGTIHELGHALSLPHCRQRKDEAIRGEALMGYGNLTYARERRNEGRGTFLTQSSAMRLAAHPVFNDRVSSKVREQIQIEYRSLSFSKTFDGGMRVDGAVRSNVPIHGVIAYFDSDGDDDYDATTACAVPDEQGRFSFLSGTLRLFREASLRLVACHINGATSTREFRYGVGGKGDIDLTKIRMEVELESVIQALRSQGYDAAKNELEAVAKNNDKLHEIGSRILSRFEQPTPEQLADLESLADDVRSIRLSHVKPESAEVGFLSPTYNRVPGSQRLISIEGDYFAAGIYAHAPARHVYKLSGNWSRLTGLCGVQRGHVGAVEFIISGDGFAKYRSWEMKAGPSKRFDIDVRGVKELTLEVRRAGPGTSNLDSWGVWVEPTLTR